MHAVSPRRGARRRLETLVAMLATLGVFVFLVSVGAGAFG